MKIDTRDPSVILSQFEGGYALHDVIQPDKVTLCEVHWESTDIRPILT